MDKFFIPSVLSVKCRVCRQHVSVDAKKLVHPGIFYVAVIIISPFLGLMLLLVIAFVYIKWVPLVQK